MFTEDSKQNFEIRLDPRPRLVKRLKMCKTHDVPMNICSQKRSSVIRCVLKTLIPGIGNFLYVLEQKITSYLNSGLKWSTLQQNSSKSYTIGTYVYIEGDKSVSCGVWFGIYIMFYGKIPPLGIKDIEDTEDTKIKSRAHYIGDFHKYEPNQLSDNSVIPSPVMNLAFKYAPESGLDNWIKIGYWYRHSLGSASFQTLWIHLGKLDPFFFKIGVKFADSLKNFLKKSQKDIHIFDTFSEIKIYEIGKAGKKFHFDLRHEYYNTEKIKDMFRGYVRMNIE